MIYSEQFYYGSGSTSGTVVLFTVPASFVYVIRCVSISWAGTGASSIVLGMNTGGGGLLVANFSAGPADHQWEGRQVMNSGQSLRASTAVAGTTIWVSGYALST